MGQGLRFLISDMHRLIRAILFRLCALHCHLKSSCKCRDSGETISRSFGESTEDDTTEKGGYLGIERTRRYWLVLGMLKHQLFECATEGWASGQQFVAHSGEHILIGSLGGMSAPLFWCHIERCANN